MALLDPSETFSSLAESVGIDVRLTKAVQKLGLVRPTLVQAKCLPLALISGRNLLVRAKTGSGKTLAYCLPLLQKIILAKSEDQQSDENAVRAIILVPTRELCSQVHKTLKNLCYFCGDIISLAVLTASRGKNEKSKQDMARQQAMLRDRPDVVVATPSGLLAHIRNGDVVLKNSVHTLVVDEADLVLSFGYSDEVAEIIKSLPKIFQGMLMSATLSPELKSLKKIALHSPVVLKLEDDEKDSAGKLAQFYLEIPKSDKKLVIFVFLKLGLLKGKGIFFVNTTDGGYRLKLFLEQFHIRSSVLNAELPFHSRMNIIEQFNIGNFDYLIATDESADASDNANEDEDHAGKIKGGKKDEEYGVSRGLDFQGVSFVLNVDFPPSARSYAHRVGRTARGGAKGVALSLVDQESDEQYETLLEVQKEQPKLVGSGIVDNISKLQAAAKGDGDDQPTLEQPQPTPLDFDLGEIEGFRYRVNDVSRAVTKVAVRETRAAELRAEILNSDRLQSHFDENPADLQLLRHDRVATHVSKVQDHLKNVPKYLLPRGMEVADMSRKRKRNRKRRGGSGQRRSDNDPLQSFDGENSNLDSLILGAEGDGENEGEDAGDDVDMPNFDPEEERNAKRQNVGSLANMGKSTAGRNAWKERHKKGKFSNKKRKSDYKKTTPLGI